MSGYPVIPSPSTSNGPVPNHTHPIPKWLRRSLVIGAVALVVFGIAIFYSLARVASVVHQGDQASYQSCVQRHDNAELSFREFDHLLTQLQPTTDPAIRSFLMTARDVSKQTLATTRCEP